MDATTRPTLGALIPGQQPLPPRPACLADTRSSLEIYRAQAMLVRDMRHRFAKMATLMREINAFLVTWGTNDYELARREEELARTVEASYPAGPSPDTHGRLPNVR